MSEKDYVSKDEFNKAMKRIDGQFDNMNQKFDSMDQKFNILDGKFNSMDDKIDSHYNELCKHITDTAEEQRKFYQDSTQHYLAMLAEDFQARVDAIGEVV